MKKHVPEPLRRMVETYFEKRVSRSSAAFAFYFTLSLFPLLIVLSVMLGSLHIEADSLAALLQGVIPQGSLEILLSYLRRASAGGGEALLAAGLASMIMTSAAAFRVIQTTMADIQGAPRFRGIFSALFSFAFAALFLAVIYLSMVIVVTGTWFVHWLGGVLGIGGLGGVWNWLRFVLMFLTLSCVLWGIYRLTAPPEKPRRQKLVGALSGSAALVLLSMAFSWFIGMSTSYSLIYGSLASIVILMLWLYLCGNVLIMGEVLNIVINSLRADLPKPRKDGIPPKK